MATVPITLQRLWVDRDSGRLRDLCQQAEIDLLLLFGDSLRNPTAARVVDLAFSCSRPGLGERAAHYVRERYGALVRLHPLDGMPAERRRETAAGAAVLVGRARGKFQSLLASGVEADA